MAYDLWNTCVGVPDVTVNNCAAWVQAWGSILALGVAIGVGWWQHWSAKRLQAERDAAEEARQTMQAAALLEDSLHPAAVAVQAIKDAVAAKTGVPGHITHGVREAHSSLLAAAVQPMPPETAIVVVSVRGMIAQLGALLETSHGHPIRSETEVIAVYIIGQIDICMRRMRELRKQADHQRPRPR